MRSEVSYQVESDDADALGAGTLGALTCIEGHSLSFLQLVERRAFDGRLVEEHVVPIASRDEPEALVGESLDCTFSHFFHILSKRQLGACSRDDPCGRPIE